MANLYLKGETGATLDADRRLLGDLKIRDAKVAFASLEPDALTWTARTADVDAGQTIVPDLGQKVSLYLDEDRLFHGHVTETTALLYGVRIKVEGPLWWLKREDAASDQDDEEGSTAERPAVVFAEQEIETSISGLIDLARGLGLPIREGTVASMFEISRVSYSLTSFLTVLSRLLEWCPDAVAWCDHSAHSGEVQAATSTTVQLDTGASTEDDFYNGQEIEIRSGANEGETRVISDYDGGTKTATISPAWTTTPSASDDYTLEHEVALNVSRRGSMSATTLTIGTTELSEPFEFRPRVDLEVAQVSLQYADKDGTTGAVQFQSQESGSYSLGKRQIVSISGPELSDFTPPTVAELGDFTHAFSTTTNDLKTAIESAWPGFADLDSDFSEGGSGWVLGVASLTTTKTVNDYRGTGSKSGETWTAATKSASRRWIIFEDGREPPQWAIDQYELEAWTPSHLYFVDGNSVTATPAYSYDRRVALLSLFQPDWYFFSQSKTNPSAVGAFEYIWAVRELREEQFTLWTIPLANIPGSGPLVHGAAASLASPPVGLAASMLSASNFTPWEGRATIQLEDLSTTQRFANKYHVSGSLTAAATAGALLRRHSIDLRTRRETLEFGPPLRQTYRNLVDRIQRTAPETVYDL